MGFWSRLIGRPDPPQPRTAYQPSGGGIVINTPAELEAALRTGTVTASGESVTPDRAMRVAAVFRCVALRAGVVANMPLDLKRRLDARTREDAEDHPVWKILKRRPNRWQTPSQFRRMMTAHLLMRGNAYAMKVMSRGEVIELIPLHPDQVVCKQLDDLSLSYTYTRRDGRQVVLGQADVFHLVGLTLDGVSGVSVITYARETIGLSLAMETHGAATFRNGARPSAALTHPNTLGEEGQASIRASLDAFRTGGEMEGKALILEEGMTYAPMSMTAEDAQWIEARKFSRTDIAMMFGVPPHMLGDTEKSTSWGTGIEAQTQGFVTFTSEDDLTSWEETVNRDLISDQDSDLYARFNRAALVRGDLKARKEFYVAMLQWGVFCPDDVLALEDKNPRADGQGGQFYDPPNTAGGQSGETDEPAQPA